MIELPEAASLAAQLNKTVKGKKIVKVIAASSPHKFVWYYDDPQKYHSLLKNKTINKVINIGGMIKIKADNAVILFSDGVCLRYHLANESLPKKHQLLIESGYAVSSTTYYMLWSPSYDHLTRDGSAI